MRPTQLESKSSFWIITAAIKEFFEKHNALPLPGSVPDMKAESDVYVELQNIYKAKARQDVAEVLETVRAHTSGKDIDAVEVETFCKNAAFVKLIRDIDSAPFSLQKIASKQDPNYFVYSSQHTNRERVRKRRKRRVDGHATVPAANLSGLECDLTCAHR